MQNTHKLLSVVFGTIFSTVLIITILVYYLKVKQIFPDIFDRTNIANTVFPVLELISIILGYFLYDRKAKESKLNRELTDEQRLLLYKSATIIKLATFNGAAIANAIIILLVFQKNYLYMAAIIAVLFILNIPSESRYKRDFLPVESIQNEN